MYTGADYTGTAFNGKTDALAAYLSGLLLPTTYLAPPTYMQDLSGQSLEPGVYEYNDAVAISKILTLDSSTYGGPNNDWVFKIATTLTVDSNAKVVMNGHPMNPNQSACNVFWLVGTSATLGSGSVFIGNLLSAASITAVHGANTIGGLYAWTGALTLDTNTIVRDSCVSSTSVSIINPLNSAIPKFVIIDTYPTYRKFSITQNSRR